MPDPQYLAGSRPARAGPSPRVRRRRRAIGAVLVIGLLVGAVVLSRSSGPTVRPVTGHGHQVTTTVPATVPVGAGPLAAGSQPDVLPGAVLIADEDNNRLLMVDPQGRITWQFPQPGDLRPGEQFRLPDDAFFTPDGKQIIATEEEFSVISLIDIASRRIVWRYGGPGMPGSGPNQVSNPDDAIVLPDGFVLTADIKNCRLLLIAPGQHQPYRVIGTTTSACLHRPPARWGSPNGAFPMANGHYLVTEINGDWADEIDLSGHLYWSVHPPGVRYPSDTNEISDDVYLTVDYSVPGAIETFDRAGRLLWRYSPTGPDALHTPSLALPLPNGDIICNDDADHRVIVVDPRTDRIVWQYGVTGVAGAQPGLLDNPDGIDLAPPYSDLIVHAAMMGLPGLPR